MSKPELTTLSADARMTWKALRNGGGWWSCGEVAEYLAQHHNGPLREMTSWQMAAGRHLATLHSRQHVVRRTSLSGSFTYGVTTSCLPIEGESLMPS